MVETIVCGIDASEAADPVAGAARWLADGLGARLVLVHVVEEPAAEAEELVASVRARVRVTDDADVRLVEGSPAERLLEAAERRLWAEPDQQTLAAIQALYLKAEGDLESGT